VNAEWKLNNGMKATAIIYAAVFGFGQMVKLLLNSGASQIVANKYRPLSAALAKGHEHVALRLLRDLEAAGKLHSKVSAAYLEIALASSWLRLSSMFLNRRRARSERTTSTRHFIAFLQQTLIKGISTRESCIKMPIKLWSCYCSTALMQMSHPEPQRDRRPVEKSPPDIHIPG
jgi:hypothetical protein